MYCYWISLFLNSTSFVVRIWILDQIVYANKLMFLSLLLYGNVCCRIWAHLLYGCQDKKFFFFLRSILFFQSNTLFRREVDQKLNCLINTIFTKKWLQVICKVVNMVIQFSNTSCDHWTERKSRPVVQTDKIYS